MEYLRVLRAAALVAVGVWSLAGCSSSQSSSSASPSPAAAPAHTALPAGTKTPVTFTFTDVEVATGGSNALKVTFSIANQSKDPQICDYSEFSIQLSDGSVADADGSADNSCTPDTIDPNGGAGTATMYFDMPHPYTGPVTMFMVVNDTVVGQGTTTLK